MQIQQLQVAYDAREDRLILRIATAQREEFLIALTRRLIKKLWPYLQQMLNEHLGGAEAPKPIVQSPTEEAPGPDFGGGTFDEAYKEGDLVHPLGVEPIIAMESQLQPIDGPACRIMLGEIGARRVTLDCDRDLMDALCAMIRATVDKAEWDLDLAGLRGDTDTSTDAEPAPTVH